MKRMDEKLKCIRLLILDVDGVLTDGGILINGNGEESKRFHVRDGYGLKLLQRVGISIVLLSGRPSTATSLRAAELGIEEVHQGIHDKLSFYENLLEEKGLKDEQVAFMGDDWIDVPLLLRTGVSATVADAVEEAKDAADYVTERKGGEGAVREFIELILRKQDGWNEIRKSLGLAGKQRIRCGQGSGNVES